MVSLAQRSSSGAWIQERGGLKWRTGIFFADMEGKDGTMTSSCLPHLLSSPLHILILSMLSLQIPKGSQLLGQAGDVAFAGRRISGGWGGAVGITEAVDFLVRWVKPGRLLGSLGCGGRVGDSLWEERGREQRKKRVGRKFGGALPSSQLWKFF